MARRSDEDWKWSVGADGDTHMDTSGGTKRGADEISPDASGSGSGSGSAGKGPSNRGRRMVRVEDAAAMDAGDNSVGMELARLGGPGTNGIAKETPIMNVPPTYGLQETHTTILPWTGYVTAAGLDKQTPLQLPIRLNAIGDMLPITVVASPARGTNHATKRFETRPVDANGWTQSNYPSTLAAGTDNTERPAWRDYWCAIYEYYTVLGCEYEIVIENPLNVPLTQPALSSSTVLTTPSTGPILTVIPGGWANTDCVAAVQVDTYSDNAGASGNVMPQALYTEVRSFKNIKWYPIKGGGRKTVIRGTYSPGDAKRNVANDGDVKTWTSTAAPASTLPTLKEFLTVNLWKDPFFNASYADVHAPDTSNVSNTASERPGVLNMEINLKYIVQFKDLRTQPRYPNQSIGAAVTQSFTQNTANMGTQAPI